MECLLPYLCMVIVPHIMVRLERMLDYRGVRLAKFFYSSNTAENSEKTFALDSRRALLGGGERQRNVFKCMVD